MYEAPERQKNANLWLGDFCMLTYSGILASTLLTAFLTVIAERYKSFGILRCEVESDHMGCPNPGQAINIGGRYE